MCKVSPSRRLLVRAIDEKCPEWSAEMARENTNLSFGSFVGYNAAHQRKPDFVSALLCKLEEADDVIFLAAIGPDKVPQIPEMPFLTVVKPRKHQAGRCFHIPRRSNNPDHRRECQTRRRRNPVIDNFANKLF